MWHWVRRFWSKRRHKVDFWSFDGRGEFWTSGFEKIWDWVECGYQVHSWTLVRQWAMADAQCQTVDLNCAGPVIGHLKPAHELALIIRWDPKHLAWLPKTNHIWAVNNGDGRDNQPLPLSPRRITSQPVYLSLWRTGMKEHCSGRQRFTPNDYPQSFRWLKWVLQELMCIRAIQGVLLLS